MWWCWWWWLWGKGEREGGGGDKAGGGEGDPFLHTACMKLFGPNPLLSPGGASWSPASSAALLLCQLTLTSCNSIALHGFGTMFILTGTLYGFIRAVMREWANGGWRQRGASWAGTMCSRAGCSRRTRTLAHGLRTTLPHARTLWRGWVASKRTLTMNQESQEWMWGCKYIVETSQEWMWRCKQA